jgi:hypothetical protein
VFELIGFEYRSRSGKTFDDIAVKIGGPPPTKFNFKNAVAQWQRAFPTIHEIKLEGDDLVIIVSGGCSRDDLKKDFGTDDRAKVPNRVVKKINGLAA